MALTSALCHNLRLPVMQYYRSLKSTFADWHTDIVDADGARQPAKSLYKDSQPGRGRHAVVTVEDCAVNRVSNAQRFIRFPQQTLRAIRHA